MSNGDEVDLESQEFREALLSRLNGQGEEQQRLIKLVDTRFKSHARRMREHRQEHTTERRRTERMVLATLAAAPGATVTLLKVWEAFA